MSPMPPKPRCVSVLKSIRATCVAAVLVVTIAPPCVAAGQKSKAAKKETPAAAPAAMTSDDQGARLPDVSKIHSVALGEREPGVPYNASGIVEIADGRFLFCDNKDPGALFEIRLDAEGNRVGFVVRRPLKGVDPGAIGDVEGMTTVRLRDETFVVATSSFNRLHTYDGKKMVAAEGFAGGLLRIREEADGTLSVKNLPDFRNWLVSQYKELVPSALNTPDEGGLNIEGLAWDPVRHALMFGLRTPLIDGKPVVLPVKLVGNTRAWDLTRFKALPAVALQIEGAAAAQGVRSIEYDRARKAYWLSVGKAVSGTKVPFALYSWDGATAGTVRRLVWVEFSKKFKVEGLTPALLGGKDALVLLDDAGGFVVLWGSDLRLQ